MMADFKVGDVVRFKTDEPGRLPLIVRDSEGEFLHCSSECKRRRATSHFSDLELVNRPDPQADLKQVIREVLLSDEFMAKFAAAWMKTPIPMAMQYESRCEIASAKDLAMWGISEAATEATNDPT